MEHDDKCCKGVDINWWATLVIAVLALPALGIIVSLLSGAHGFFQVAIFIVTCWVGTYLGMLLMKNPKMSEKINLTRKP
jgi:hypothetical protein